MHKGKFAVIVQNILKVNKYNILYIYTRLSYD